MVEDNPSTLARAPVNRRDRETQPNAALPGVLRVLVLFHETEVLGASTSVLRVVDHLSPYGWTMSGWVPGHGPLRRLAQERLAFVAGGDRPVAFSVQGWREPPGIRTRARRAPAYARDLRTALLRARPHVVHANTLLALPEALIARSFGIPVVLQAHEIPRSSAKRRATLHLASRASDVLVAVSDAVAAMLRPHAGRTPVVTVYNGAPDVQPTAPPGSHQFTVGTVGTVSRTKGTDIFLRAAQLAAEQRPDIRFEHVGARNLHRETGLDDEVDRLLAGCPPGSMAMLGQRPAETVLPNWDVFVLASRSEGFPLVTLEAMATGVPVVATAVGGVTEQIDHLENGILVPPETPEAIASWLIRLHDEPELRQRLANAAGTKARKNFTLDAQASGLHRAYLAALNLRFGPPGVRRSARAEE